MSPNTIYFDEASPEHTERVVQIVKEFLVENKQIDKLIVATTTGKTGAIFAKNFKEMQVIVVSHHTGFRTPNENELLEENRKLILENGADLLTTTHAFAGVARGIRRSVDTWTPTEMMAIAYRTFGQGTKVCAEIAMMAADAGLARTDEDVLSIGGTGFGADTVWIVQPAHTNDFPELKMRACICKPKDF
jgi:hypothetical protein